MGFFNLFLNSSKKFTKEIIYKFKSLIRKRKLL